MDPNVTATQPAQPAQVPPPPGGGAPVANPNYQAPQAQQPPASNVSNTPPPPPGGGTAVPNPHYVAPLSNSDDSIPAFIRNSVDVSKVQQTVDKPGGREQDAIADVKSDDPNHIHVFQPGGYDKDTRNHELTHVYQDSRNSEDPNVVHVFGKDFSTHPTDPTIGAKRANNSTYDYGGIEGLKKARNAHKTIADFGIEQQADMVSDYKKQHDQFLQKVKTGKATKADLQKMSDLQNAYHPFIEQLANMPSKDAKIHPGYLNLLLGRNMPTINTHPDAPGLPSFATAGMGEVTADPLMGGHSQPIHRKEKK